MNTLMKWTPTKITSLMALALSALTMSLAAPTAQATVYNQLDADSSTVQFHYKQMGVNMRGTFSQYSAQIQYDTEQPQAASVQFDVQVQSVSSGNRDANKELANKLWFNASQYPTAQFTSTNVEVVSDTKLQVTGTLAIKGSEQQLTFPVQVNHNGTQAQFTGELNIKRGDFHVGEGMWSGFDIVGNDIRIAFDAKVNAQ